jgi:hypothetical protein
MNAAFTPPPFPWGRAVRQWWRESMGERGLWGTLWEASIQGFNLLRDYLPARRRLRYGDIDFDCDFAVDTTWANVKLGTRVREILAGRQYQPTDPSLFREIVSGLRIEYSEFTFIDLGSGKGRALLLASEFPFRRIVGIELLPELHTIAKQNVRQRNFYVRPLPRARTAESAGEIGNISGAAPSQAHCDLPEPGAGNGVHPSGAVLEQDRRNN